jgi:DNA-binding beta-propeller fold protein YncE
MPWLLWILLASNPALSQPPAAPGLLPLALVQTIEMPEVPTGPYADHMALDVEGRRLFATPQANHAVDVLDLQSGKLLHSIRGIGNPHAVLFRGDRRRLFVSDGAGKLWIFNSDSYREITSIALQVDADGIAYDARSGLLYVANGGEAAGKSYTLISIIDTARERRIGEIRVEAASLEAMIVDPTGGRLYVNTPDSNAIAVIDLALRTQIATWPVTRSRRNEAFALDVEDHRLYVGCNDGDVRGSVVVIDTRTGEELRRLPIGSWVDSMYYDTLRHRLYASTGIGEVFTYERLPGDTYRALEPVDTAVMARTALYSPQLDRLYVTVPHLGWTVAKVLVFAPQ